MSLTLDPAKLLALAKAHPDRVCEILRVAIDGIVQNNQIIVDAATLLEGGSHFAFLKAHPKYVAELVAVLSKNVFLDPPLFKEVIGALTL